MHDLSGGDMDWNTRGGLRRYDKFSLTDRLSNLVFIIVIFIIECPVVMLSYAALHLMSLVVLSASVVRITYCSVWTTIVSLCYVCR